MFCEEPIIAAYEGGPKYDDRNENAFFDCFFDIAFHTTKGYRIILETEHFYISLGTDGAVKTVKNCSIEEFARPDEEIDPYIHTDVAPPWVDYESTLFVGERMIDVEKKDGSFLFRFDDFCMKLVSHNNGMDIRSLDKEDIWSYNHVYGLERLLKRKCICGGTGKLLLDFVSDYVVRCDRCKRSTWAQMNAIDAIKDWEAGELHCDLSVIVIE